MSAPVSVAAPVVANGIVSSALFGPQVSLDTSGGRAVLEWRLTRLDVSVSVTLRHTRTGETKTVSLEPPTRGDDDIVRARMNWSGLLDSGDRAFNGAYTWSLRVTPYGGQATTATGSFTVVRKPRLHDFDDNGSPDLLARNSGGKLEHYSSNITQIAPQMTGYRTAIGLGWEAYDRIEVAGNVAGASHPDLLARDKSGVLWLYQGNGRTGFATRVRVGSGWNAYDKLAGGSDLTGDGRADLLATDKTGVLWLYKGTGSATSPFATRTRIGGGWGVYNDLSATGNLAGTAAGDLLARDRSGVLWLYQGNGSGGFTARTQVGGGWGSYRHVTGIGDADNDGRADVFAVDSTGTTYLYKSTGTTTGLFKPRTKTGMAFSASAYNHVT
ncbi:FG-GAP repeat domain-containing protein [Streptomyces sp. NPDC012421]|uniref:FG-GAP repeat domain-containing protein n=1 Tax=Streptomyces sp. NPDC012421 TaxID=3364832 RepID=UPI0036EED94E